MYRGYQLPRSFAVQLSHPERLRFTIGDLEAVLAEFGYGDTRAERQLRLRLADARHRLRDAVPTRPWNSRRMGKRRGAWKRKSVGSNHQSSETGAPRSTSAIRRRVAGEVFSGSASG
jgi:hypothetical protein